jgi:hypothetical protein
MERNSLFKACGIVNPVVVNVSPNKENIFIGFPHITEEAQALKNLSWISDMIRNEKGTTPQMIIFCKTFNDIASVLSFLLMTLKNEAFIEREDIKTPLESIMRKHGKT